ncbi:hypothetical protein ACH41E_29105 [Streptomyces sp. NPDC020412]|uniref:hypothetical protein n=1 Tax=Streptomyces sp. NPDC020412 TaxID=3365073 RepID=UPI0037933C25
MSPVGPLRPTSRTGAFVTAFAASRAGYETLRRVVGDTSEGWRRENRAGRSVDLFAGPAVAGGSVLGSGGAAGAAVVAAAAACGAYDDVAGRGDPRRGFRAHLGALRRGEVTSGTVKLVGIGAAGLLAGALLKDRPVDKLLAGVVIAGTAHAVNLVDVAPGRAVLAVLGAGAPGLLRGGAAGAYAASAMGSVAAVALDDLGQRTMLGDTGAHAAGAALGTAIAAGNGRVGLALHAAALVGAAAYGQRVSALVAGTPRHSGPTDAGPSPV